MRLIFLNAFALEPYRFGYQGQFAEKDEETGWNAFELRMYDPVVGRWLTVDPARQHFSPYLSMGNNPIYRVDPDGGYDNPPKDGPTGITVIDYLINIVQGWLSFEFSGNKNETFQKAANHDIEAQSQIESHLEAADKIAFYTSFDETTPYVSLSVGKQTGEGSLLSGYGSLMLTNSGLYGTVGGDITLSAPALYTGTSVGISTGLILGPHSDITGWGIGAGGGSILGVEYGRSINSNFTFGGTQNIGLTITNTPLYISGNGGYTFRFISFGN